MSNTPSPSAIAAAEAMNVLHVLTDAAANYMNPSGPRTQGDIVRLQRAVDRAQKFIHDTTCPDLHCDGADVLARVREFEATLQHKRTADSRDSSFTTCGELLDDLHDLFPELKDTP